ncbi:MAG: hypothetical protein COY81_01685 [Candidatus Pacebacteria bacterium CG_4_10_14_0_8_um_filter_43_12]|nr:MAG: hypothetical protein COY81_01685 [Candidatus Pacebacteria bacterium CG_4_10_14_0_8_um_filter_43_12]
MATLKDWWSVVVSFVYSLGQITLGLLLHPYQTMQSLVADKIFIWMTLLPVGVYVITKILWLFLIVPTVRFVFSCSKTSFVGCDLIPFFANWLVLFCIYWQILLIYLLLRFFFVFRTS